MQNSQTHLKQSIRQTCILKLRICILKQDLFSNEIQSLYSQHNRIIQLWNCTAALPLCTNEQDLGRTLLGKRQMLYVIKQLRPKVKKISKGHPLPLFCLFSVFFYSNKHYIFNKKSIWKMSCPCTVPGFKPTTSRPWVISHNH